MQLCIVYSNNNNHYYYYYYYYYYYDCPVRQLLPLWLCCFHVARYYHLISEKPPPPPTHQRQLGASAIRRGATLSHRWSCWRRQIPNDKTTNYPRLTSKSVFKTEGEVCFDWRIDHATELNWEWYNLGLKLKVTHDDLMKAYGIDLEDSPWPIGTALEYLPVFIPSRGIPHGEKLCYPPFSRKLCAPTFP